MLNRDDLHYVHKRTLSQKAVDTIINDLIEISHTTDELQKEIALYGFFDPELASLFSGNETKSSLQKSLLSLETIRFATAMNVFVLLDNFVTPFIRQSGESPVYIQDQIDLFTER